MAALLTLALLSSVYAQENKNKYVKSTDTYQNRAAAQQYCQSQSATLATILSVTDNHDARKRCGTEPNGCWIGLTGSVCTTGTGTGDSCTYVWDDSSLLSTYGFTTGDPADPAENPLTNAHITPDGPWESLSLDPPAETSCVYLDGMDLSGNGMVNRRWLLGSCDDGSTARHAICNRVTPTQELFFYPMTSSTGATDWTQAPAPTPSPSFALPFVSDRCKYSNDNNPVSGITYDRSAVLQGCWAMKDSGSGVVTHLERLYPTTGFENCQLQFNIDPWSSSAGEACIVEYTANGGSTGSTWTNIGAYGSSDADTIFLDLPPDADDNANFGVRMTRDANCCNTNTECYFNNFYLRCDSASTDPTIDPTVDPTTDPTIDPTRDPTIDPTIDPTTDPTIDPTRDPTKDPTNDPTSDPIESSESDDSSDDCCSENYCVRTFCPGKVSLEDKGSSGSGSGSSEDALFAARKYDKNNHNENGSDKNVKSIHYQLELLDKSQILVVVAIISIGLNVFQYYCAYQKKVLLPEHDYDQDMP